MKQFKKVETTTTVDQNMKVETKSKTTLHTIRTWDELTKEEKEKEIEYRHEAIYELYQDDLYHNFLYQLAEIKEKYENIDFENIYIDSNSQGNWIDDIRGFKYCGNSINIYGEWVEVEDIDFHIRKYIDSYDLYLNEYYIDDETMEKIKKTKKYKKWISNIKKEIESWINEVNEACKYIMSREYSCPYNLDDPEDEDFLNMFFADEDFETVEVLENE